MPSQIRTGDIVFIVDLSGSMTEGAKLRIVLNSVKTALQTFALGLRPDFGFGLRVVYVAERLEEFPIGEDFEIPAPSASGGTFDDDALADYLSAHRDGQDLFFLFSDVPHDTSAADRVFTILVGDEVPPEKYTGNTISAETFPSLWQIAAEGGQGGAS